MTIKVTKKKRLDRRTKLGIFIEDAKQHSWETYAAAILLGILAAAIFVVSFFKYARQNPPTKSGIIVQQVEAKADPFCFDPIMCIRDVGEELGVSNTDIMTAVRIGKCESGLRPDAINKNKNGTFDIGVFQINDIHGKRISRADRMDFKQNIRFAWKLYFESGKTFRHWFSSQKCWSK